jgi:TRAP-type C4-dicarboxylate transport system permease small subunit
MLALLRRCLDALSTAALWIAGGGMLAMTLVVAWHIFARYVLSDTPSWTEPIVLQLMSWFILLGAAVGVRESFHLGLDILVHRLNAGLARLVDLAILVLIACFGAAMAWYGAKLAIGTWTATIPVLGLPGGFDFLPLVAGGGLIAVFAVERLVLTAVGEAPVAEGETLAAAREVV